MSGTWRSACALLSNLFVVCLLAATLVPAHAAAQRDRVPDTGVGAFLIHSDAEVELNDRSWRGSTVVLQSWQTDELARLKRLNPDLTVLMYKNMSATYRNSCARSCTVDDDHQPGGVGYYWAMENHPDWFLRDQAGHQVEWADWRGLFPMDTTLAAYQDTWTANVLDSLRAADWDGVMLDDTLTWLSHPTVNERVSVQIPDDEAQYAATGAFLERVGPAIKQSGFDVVPNVTLAWNNWRATLEDWTPHVSGWENEHFTMWGRGGGPRFRDTDDWGWKVEMAHWLADRDLPLLAVTYSTARDMAAMRFHRATWLLTWNGRTGASIFVTDDPTVRQNPRPSAEHVGQPRGSRQRHPSGVWSRAYADGLVLVNPTGSRVLHRVGRGYETRSGSAVRKIRLGPSTGRVLYAR